MNEQTNVKVGYVSPLKRICMTIGELPASYLETMTYYEMLLWFTKYLKETLIPTINNNAEAVTELQNLYEELRTYVNDYFDNLDVQEEIDNKLEEMAESGELQAILLDKPYVTIEQFKEESDSDDTNAFNLAVADGRPIYLLDETYTVSDTIEITPYTQIIGKSRVDSIINFTPTNKYLFSFIGEVRANAYSYNTNLKLSNFKAVCKYFVQIGDDTLEDANWVKQPSMLTMEFSNLWLQGTYKDTTDSYKQTNTLSNLSTMKGYGIAFNLNSMFDSIIKECRIEYFGIGCFLKGCDINYIRDSRFVLNGHDVWLQRVSTYGSQNRIIHNDILRTQRYGSIRVEANRFDTVEDNYFEAGPSNQAGCAVYGNSEYSISIINNRIDKPSGIDINIFDLSPQNTDNICYNRVNPASNKAYIKISEEHLASSVTWNTAYIKDNNSKLEIKGLLTCNNATKPTFISPYSLDRTVHNLAGSLVSSYPFFTLNTTNNRYHFNTGSSGAQVYCNFERCFDYYNKPPVIRLTYVSPTSTTVYTVITGDGTEIFRGNISLDNDGDLHSVEKDLSLDTTYNTISIQMILTSAQEIYSVELI